MTPILLITGPSGSGKTTLMEALIAELARQGIRVGAVKHTRHRVEADTEGKDTWRFTRAGAVVTALSTPSLTMILRPDETPLPLLLEQAASGADLVLVEGFKGARLPKLVVLREGAPAYDWRGKDEVVALASDHPVEASIPVLPLADVPLIAAFIRTRILPPPASF